VLNEDLFLQPAVSGEMFLILAKVAPFLKQLREKMNDPHIFANIEKAATRTKWGRDRLQFMIKRVETMRQKRAESKPK
jgi:chemotaxis regulatin CheY-phosphate phosphatase CheZ